MGVRRKYIDYLKLVSAYCIVLLHVNSNSLHQVQNFLSENHLIVANAIHQLLYVAVPVFMILTGAGMFGKEMDGYKSVWPNIRRILLCIVMFGSIFEISRIVIRKESISFIQFFCDVVNGNSWSHMWFLNQLLGIYLVGPLLSCFLKKAKKQDVWIMTVIGFMAVIFVPFLFGMLGMPCNLSFPISIPFFVYILIGYLIEHTAEDTVRKYRYLFLIGFIICAIGVLVFTVSFDNSIMREDHPISFICATMAVYMAKAFANGETTKKMVKLSRCSLGVYIIHPAIIHLLMIKIPNPQLKLPFINVTVVALIVYLVSLIFVYLFRWTLFVTENSLKRNKA